MSHTITSSICNGSHKSAQSDSTWRELLKGMNISRKVSLTATLEASYHTQLTVFLLHYRSWEEEMKNITKEFGHSVSGVQAQICLLIPWRISLSHLFLSLSSNDQDVITLSAYMKHIRAGNFTNLGFPWFWILVTKSNDLEI